MASLDAALEIVDQLTDTLKTLVKAFDERITRLENAVSDLQGNADDGSPRRGPVVPGPSSQTKKKVSFQKGQVAKPKTKTPKKTWKAGAKYEVEEILDRQEVKGQVQYKVKWKGWSLKDCTWEPPEHLTVVQSLVDDFEEARKEKGTKRPKSSSSTKQDQGPAKKLLKLTHKVSSKRPSRSR